MPTKEEILNDLSQYSIEELVNFIIEHKIITLEEINADDEFPFQKRNELKSALQNKEEQDFERIKSTNSIADIDDFIQKYPTNSHKNELECRKKELQQKDEDKECEIAWVNCDKNDVQALNNYINSFPNSKYVSDAQNRIIELQDPTRKKPLEELVDDINTAGDSTTVVDMIQSYIDSKKVSKDDILSIIKENHNLFNVREIRALIKNRIIDYHSLKENGIEDDIIKKISSGEGNAIKFDKPKDLSHLQNRPCTEIYFWGIPSSGKTCALGSILSVAGNGEIAEYMAQELHCQGYDYMNKLSAIFKNSEVNFLPEGTPTNSIYEMGFTLKGRNGDNHPITCIDLAGELFLYMYKKLKMSVQNLTPDETKLLDTLDNVLLNSQTGNRKMHFFVIEYGAEERRYEDLTQKEYLANAIEYINDKKIFDNKTDGIYIIVTKADKADGKGTGRLETIKKYLNEKYKNFYNRLLNICAAENINGGEIGIISFSLGDVWFKNLCRIDDTDARVVVELMLRDTGTDGPSNPMLKKLWKIFKQ